MSTEDAPFAPRPRVAVRWRRLRRRFAVPWPAAIATLALLALAVLGIAMGLGSLAATPRIDVAQAEVGNPMGHAGGTILWLALALVAFALLPKALTLGADRERVLKPGGLRAAAAHVRDALRARVTRRRESP